MRPFNWSIRLRVKWCTPVWSDSEFLRHRVHEAITEIGPLICKKYLGVLNWATNRLTNASTISTAVVHCMEIPSEYFVKRPCIVRIWVDPLLVTGNGLTISMATLSKADHGVSVIVIGCLVLTRINFLSWQFLQCWMYFERLLSYESRRSFRGTVCTCL